MAAEKPSSLLRFLSSFLKLTRWAFVLALGSLTAMFAVEFLLNALFVSSQRLNSLLAIKIIRGITEPVVTGLISILRFKTRFRDVELMPLIIATVVYFVMAFLDRQALQLAAMVDAEYQLRQLRFRRAQNNSLEGLAFSSTSTDKARRGFWNRGLRGKEAERDRLLRDFTEVKRRLEKTKQRLAFLSVDIVGSSRIKLGQDRLFAERLFREYRYLLEQIFTRYRYRAASWTPDGVMACFSQAELACGAAKELLKKLPAFNEEKNPLEFPIQVRCGLNAGEVYYDESTPLELLSDRVLDITGHLQKAAGTDSLLITEEIHQQLRDKTDFVAIDQEVDGHEVFEWRQTSVRPTPDLT